MEYISLSLPLQSSMLRMNVYICLSTHAFIHRVYFSTESTVQSEKEVLCRAQGWVGAWNKIWRGEWYLGWDGNISLVFFCHPACLSISLQTVSQSTPGGPLWSPAQSSGNRAFMPRATSRSMGLFWQGLQQWMGIITVSLQLELAGMKAVCNVQKSPCNYLKARGEREREMGERESGWNECWWETRMMSLQVVHLERPEKMHLAAQLWWSSPDPQGRLKKNNTGGPLTQ